jgi:hypothetical protein
MLFLVSTDEWVFMPPEAISLKQGRFEIELSMTPPLSGPASIKLEVFAFDRYGLTQTRFEIEPVKLTVIPRAKYAAWLIQGYLAGSSAGSLPLTSEFEVKNPTHGLRRGTEYYGSRLYQPGDSYRSIDWKHSTKNNNLISKEYAEFHGRPAVILVNLVVGNAEEADKVAYKVMVTALSLAQENVPSSLTAYDTDSIKVVTDLLTPRQLVQYALETAGKITTTETTIRYMKPPDVTRLRGNITRLGFSDNAAAQTLRQLLQMEYKNLGNIVKENPVSRAIETTLKKSGQQATVMVISQHNHDAEVLAFQTARLASQGNKIINI